MERVIGSVSRAFLPYWSDRFPISGIITTVPNPMICKNSINSILLFPVAPFHRLKSKTGFLANTKASTFTTSMAGYKLQVPLTPKSYFF